MQNIVKNISTIVPANLSFSSFVRKMSQSLFETFNICDKEVFRLVLVMDELFMNAVKYGSNCESSVHINFLLTDENLLTIFIEDEGLGDDCNPEDLKAKIAMEFQHHDDSKTSGRGLAQISLNIADSFEVTESQYGGIKVEFTKKIK